MGVMEPPLELVSAEFEAKELEIDDDKEDNASENVSHEKENIETTIRKIPAFLILVNMGSSKHIIH
jgi:hypothetical protein